MTILASSPCLDKIKILLKKAERGLIIKGKTKSAVGALMQKMLHASGSDKILLLLQTLNLIEKSKKIKMYKSIIQDSIFKEYKNFDYQWHFNAETGELTFLNNQLNNN